MATPLITGTGNGTAPVVNITFEYLDQDHVKASVEGVSVPFTWTGGSQITFDAVVAIGDAYRVYRETPIDAPLVDYADTSVLSSADLNLADTQLRYKQEELSVLTDELEIEGVVVSPLRGTLEEEAGAGIVGYGVGQTYPVGSVGSALQQTIASGSFTVGVLPAGTTLGAQRVATVSGDAGGSSDYRNLLLTSITTGSASMAQSNVLHLQSEARHSSGTLSFGRALEGYFRLGLAGSSNGDVAAARVYEGHIANESADGDITDAFVYQATTVDLGDGAGNIVNLAGFHVADQGHATRVTGQAIGLHVANFTGGAPITAAVRSEMSYGTGKWGWYGSGGASNFTAGRLRIGGSPTAPTDFLEVIGGIVAMGSGGTIASIGYGAGSGGSATQLTSKSTGVTLNGKPSGQITMHNAALAANTAVTFTFTNDTIGVNDEVSVWIKSGAAGGGTYLVQAEHITAGACWISVRNLSAGSLSEALVLGYTVRKGSIS